MKLPILLFLFVLLIGCGPSRPATHTNIDGGAVHASDTFRHEGPGQGNQTRITVTPSTQPTVTIEGAPSTARGATHVTLRDGRVIDAPGYASVVIETNDQAMPESVQRNQSADSTGAALRTDVENADATSKFNTAPTSIGTRGITGEEGGGGGLSANQGSTSISLTSIASAISSVGKLALIVGLAGIGLIVAGVLRWLLVRTDLITPLALAGMGVLLLGLAVIVDQHPWILIVAVLLAGLGGLAYWVWRNHAAALQAVVAAGESLPASIAERFKAAVGARASRSVKQTITNVKSQIPSNPPAPPPAPGSGAP